MKRRTIIVGYEFNVAKNNFRNNIQHKKHTHSEKNVQVPKRRDIYFSRFFTPLLPLGDHL